MRDTYLAYTTPSGLAEGCGISGSIADFRLPWLEASTLKIGQNWVKAVTFDRGIRTYEVPQRVEGQATTVARYKRFLQGGLVYEVDGNWVKLYGSGGI